MTESSNADLRALFERALASTRGISVPFTHEAQAIATRRWLYALRVQDRKTSQALHDETSPLWGVSPHDGIMIKVEGTSLKLIKLDQINDLDIEEL